MYKAVIFVFDLSIEKLVLAIVKTVIYIYKKNLILLLFKIIIFLLFTFFLLNI